MDAGFDVAGLALPRAARLPHRRHVRRRCARPPGHHGRRPVRRRPRRRRAVLQRRHRCAAQQRLTQIDYAGGQPSCASSCRPNDEEREPVAPELQRGTIDTLSAMAQLVRQVNETGRCEGRVMTFDGRRLAELRPGRSGPRSCRRPAAELRRQRPALRVRGASSSAASCSTRTARRCSARNAAAPGSPRSSPGGPMIPVRISFHTRWFGDATMFIAPQVPAVRRDGQIRKFMPRSVFL